jgi:hypothetical protein
LDRANIRAEFDSLMKNEESFRRGGFGGGGMAGPAGEKRADVVKQGLSEYFLFAIEGREEIKHGEPKRLSALEVAEVPLETLYKLTDRDGGAQFSKYYRFKNVKLLADSGQEKKLPAMENLGLSPLPNGEVKLFFEYANKDLAFVGGTSTKYVAIGDRVEVNDVAGIVHQINLRSTTVVTNDNISIIVPNSDFLTKPVINWSHGDTKVRMRLPFGVAYGSDVQKLKRIVPEMAARHPKVLQNPPPDIFFTAFGESSLDFELVVWTREATASPRGFQSDLYFGMEKVLRDNDIEIPFPQRDLHLRRTDPP